MREKGYYSARTGKHPDGGHLDLDALKKLTAKVYEQLVAGGYFQEAFGYDCVDAGSVPGSLGDDISGVVLVALRKDGLWPVTKQIEAYNEAELFDVLEFLFDHTSKGVDGFFHSYSDCGMHYSEFSQADGHREFRARLNPLLAIYGPGFTISEGGEILDLGEPGLATLIEASLPLNDPDNVNARVEAAIARFRRHHSSLEDRRHALRDLADVLEYLRPKIRTVLARQDEADLFNIANNFGIRHHNEKQKTHFDQAIWHRWLFYHYLATIHACLRLLERRAPSSAAQQGQ